MDVGKSFTFMFEDPNWITKLAIGGGILFLGTIFSWLVIPLIAATAVVIGYALVVTRNIYEGNPTPLPEWNDIGNLFTRGIMALIGVVLWSLPALILVCCIWLLGIMIPGAGDSRSGGAMAGFIGLIITCLSCIVAIVSVAISLFIYAPLTNFALTNQISTFWDFTTNWNFIQRNMGNYIIAFVLVIVANFLASLGVIACIIGVFWTSFWAYLVSAHLFGQVARGSLVPPTQSPMMPPSAPPPMSQPPMEPTALG